MIAIPEFKTKDELFKHLRLNKSLYLINKKNIFKTADACIGQFFDVDKDNNVVKAVINPESIKADSFAVKVAINTTNLMDSHDDVHIPGLWTKSLKENKFIYLLQEHQMSFKNIISDNVKASAVMMNWSDLEQPYKGETQVLLFDAMIEKARNEYMAEQYSKGYVKNHSVGMRYVKIEMAMNSTSSFDKEEKAVWDKYISQIANRESAEEKGYFWAVTEAKIVEGSAVPLGSNFATPTLSVGEPSNDEPDKTTQADTRIDWNNIKNSLSKNLTKN